MLAWQDEVSYLEVSLQVLLIGARYVRNDSTNDGILAAFLKATQ